MPAPHAKVIAGYEAAADELIDRYAQIPAELIFQHVLPFIRQTKGGRLLDIGAGTGRNAAWFADLGFEVTAVEPVRAFRESGQLAYSDRSICWLNDRLPALAVLRDLNEQYDLITLTAVWHHLLEAEQHVALRQIACLAKPGGRVFLSLRRGPGNNDRPCYPIHVDDIITQAKRNGFELLFRKEAPSVQADNAEEDVEWTWLVLEKPGE